jgi:carboxypeptidase Taq
MPSAKTGSNSAYRDLEARFRRIAIYGEVAGVLHWDAATTMPADGAAPRGEQLSELRVLRHRALTDPALSDLLSAATEESLDPWQSANLREMKREHTVATALPDDLVAAISDATSACEHTWRDARANADFSAVSEKLSTVITLVQESAVAYGEALNLDPYDALLESYAPGVRAADIDPVFDDYAAFLPDLLAQVTQRQAQQPDLVQPKPVSVDRQRALVNRLAAATGFSFEAGRIDVSAHPFSTGYRGDQRITVSYREDDPMGSVMAVLHECGHAAYEAGLPAAWNRQPVGQSLGMVVHESQSLSVEMQASRSDEFLGWLAGQADAVLGPDPAYTPENFRRLQQWVQPDFIRVEADEVTYPAHVILRTRLERPLLNGDLSLSDLPGAWNQGMKDLLGVNVPDNRRGCLQDIHWYDGAFGYFPTYTLGAMLAAQLAETAHTANPGISQALAQGDFSPLMQWLGNAIHAHGSYLEVDALITAATGRSLDATAFKRHLHRRYLEG